jgi:uncharacterized membrane protein YgaE (UPF0421/DUF939 family)
VRRQLGLIEAPWRRIHESWPSVVLSALAAAIAWVVAHRLLGHPQPFFAPIAAAISISTSRIQRSRRIVQMVGGVLLGIGIGEILAATIGTGSISLALIVFLTMAAAVLSGVGFVGEGMMFPNQAAASAILVVTLHRHGAGSERVVDALIGGAVAMVLGVVLFPAEPLALLYGAEREVLGALAAALRRCAVEATEAVDDGQVLEIGNAIHQQIAALARARSTARANVRVAPRRWRRRAAVDAENRRTARLPLLAHAVLEVIRTVAPASRPLPSLLGHEIMLLCGAIEQLAEEQQPWPAHIRLRVQAAAAELLEQTAADEGSTTARSLAAAARDLVRLLDGEDFDSERVASHAGVAE